MSEISRVKRDGIELVGGGCGKCGRRGYEKWIMVMDDNGEIRGKC